ncbi:MAG: S8 family serine peptidase [Calditrichaeota bacterium]|nr:S8 family serine peptidase [Calditrichota bacterium]
MRQSSLLGLSLILASFCQTAQAVPGDKYIPGRLSVRFFTQPDMVTTDAGVKLGVPELDRINSEFAGLESIAPLYQHLDRIYEPDLRLNYLLEFDDRLDMESVAALYEASGLVEYAEPDYLRPLYRTTNDPAAGNQWFLNAVRAAEAWDILPDTPDFPDMIIAVVDSGVDWNHPDLRDVIWCNPDEDLDGDGLVPDTTTPGEAAERNNIDDGTNGYVDDFYGWDWVVTTGCAAQEDCTTPDNNPMDYNGHGTHCSGISAAATNNAIGVAAVAWGSRVMCLRAGYQATDGNGYVIQSAAANAVTYAIANGAKLITMSFGGSNTVRTPSTAAYNSGLICFHAAGNDNMNQSDGLDSASGMVSVAASNSSDCKADFSNYGSWVDVTAPGVSIYDTIFDNAYASLQGTSMACPLAASVTAMLWNANPELNNVQVRSQLLATADDIYGLSCNSDYQGMLGSGRVNAYKAVNNIRETVIELGELRLEDGSGDGRFMPGEVAQFSLEVHNTGSNPSETVTVTLNTEDPAVTFPTGHTIELSAIPDGFSNDNFGNPLVLGIDEGSMPRYITFSVEVSTPNAPLSLSGELEIMVGNANVLLYDDDVQVSPVYGAYYNGLKELGIVFDWYSTASGNFPMLPDRPLDLTDYSVVVYASGGNASTFDTDEQTLFADYSASHPLLVSSQHANNDLGADSPFLQNVLHATNGAGTNNVRGAKGVAEDEVSDAMVMILQGTNGANNQAIPLDEITELNGSVPFMTDYNQQFTTGVRYDGNGRLIYLNFALEAAHGTAATMGLAAALDRYLPWLGYEVSVEPRTGITLPAGITLSPAWPNPFNPSTNLAVELDRAARVELTVYDLRGALVTRLIDGPLAAGRHQVVFGAEGLASGIYFASLSVDGQAHTVRKMVLAR